MGTPAEKQVQASAVADKRPRVLCVDDEPHVLSGLAALLGRRFEIVVAPSAAAGLKILREQKPFAVVVSDMLMPYTDGATFLEQVKEACADSVRLLLTGRSDLDTAIRAVNKGRIFRFLTKPCPPEDLCEAVAAAAEQYRLIRAERDLLEQTLRGSINVLTGMLALSNPLALSRTQRLLRLVRHMLPLFDDDKAWELEITVMLSQIGLVTVPGEVLEKVDHGLTLTYEEREVYQRYPRVGHDMIAQIPRLENVAESIALQHTRLDEFRSDDAAAQLPLGARLLKAVIDFEERAAAGLDGRAVVREMRNRRGWYDPQVLDALEEAVFQIDRGAVAQQLMLSQLSSGMILDEAVKTEKGMLLIDKGQEITFSLLMRLVNFSQCGKIREPIRVLVPTSFRGRMVR